MDQYGVGVGGLSRLRTLVHRRKSISLPVEPTVTVMKADSHLQIDPSTVVCHRCEKCSRSSGARIDGRSLQTDSTRIMRDQKEHADTEGEVQMGTTRADGRRRLDEEAWEQCHDVATVARWSPVNRGRRWRAGDEKSVP